MSKQLIAPNESFIESSKTSISTDVSAGSTVSIPVDNNNGFVADDFIVIGIPGTEKAELHKITAITGNTAIVVGTLKFAHKAGEPITKYAFDKRKFYGCATIDGSYAELTTDGSPVEISVDNPTGTRLEYSGSTYLYFKSTYYNSETDTETDIADSEAIAGDQSNRYTTLYDIRVQAGLVNNPYIGDDRIEGKRLQAENEIDSVLFNKYIMPLSEVPALIKRLCTLLAAGYLDYEEYGPDGQGVKWLGEARSILKDIKDGTRNLIASDGTEIARKTNTQGPTGYPDSVDNKNGPVRFFTMKQRF